MRGVRLAVLAAAAVAGLVPAPPGGAVDGNDYDVSATDADYAAGRDAVQARRWDEAIRRFKVAERRHPDNPDLHNYLGYAYRHVRDLDAALRHYRRALELDPRHRGAHEYIGEAYLQLGDVASAERHLAELKKICLLPCEEHDDLAKAIAAHRGGRR